MNNFLARPCALRWLVWIVFQLSVFDILKMLINAIFHAWFQFISCHFISNRHLHVHSKIPPLRESNHSHKDGKQACYHPSATIHKSDKEMRPRSTFNFLRCTHFDCLNSQKGNSGKCLKRETLP